MEYTWNLVGPTNGEITADMASDRDKIPGESEPHRAQGRSDFVGGIDNEALDFSQLEDFINDDTDGSHTYFADTLTSNEPRNVSNVNVVEHATIRHHLPVSKPQSACPTFRQPNPSYTHPHSLPESPPDSGSEPPYSPQAHSPHQKNGGLMQTDLLMQTSVYNKPNTLLVQHPSLLSPLLSQIPKPSDTSGIQNKNPLALAAAHAGLPTEDQSDAEITTVYTSLAQVTKKRKLSVSENSVRVKQETDLCGDEELSFQEGSAEGSQYLDSNTFPCIRFQPFQQSSWHILCDQNLKELHPPHYCVEADKGFNFSNADDAFVCQKKNHFQITCHTQLKGDAQFVKTPDGFRKISSFHLHFYGVKVESPSQTIKVEQSQSDRSKKAFHPVLVDWRGDQVTKVTVGRLHFSETTSNNMRKKGKPNPDQRFFYLVVGLHAHCNDNNHYAIVSLASERIIVRASNPGQFESDVELCWQRGSAADSIYHAGRVGVNTDRPDEALVVHGNMKVTGHIVQPSDLRAKRDIQECDSAQQLMNVRNLRVVKYRYDPEFSNHCGLDTQSDTGIIAQELRNILPEAVMPAGDVLLPSGTRIDNFLVVNKERILMESVGAVKELCKVTDNLESRIGELERINKRLVKLKRFDSFKSNNPAFTSVATRGKLRRWTDEDDSIICSNHLIQVTIVILILIMAMCLMAMVTLYFLEYQKRTLTFTEVAKTRISNDKMVQTRPRLRSTTTSSYWALDVRQNVTNFTSPKNDPKYFDIWGSTKKHSVLKKLPFSSSDGGISRSIPSHLFPQETHECSISSFVHSCQKLCCSSSAFQSENLPSISYQVQQYQLERADATPATNTIEELSDNGSQGPLHKEEIHKQQRNWAPTKDDLLVLHKKRQTEDLAQPDNGFSSSDFSTAHDQLGQSLIMLGSKYNTTAEHCTVQPYHNITCVLHLGQHHIDPNITLYFKLSQTPGVQLCQETRIHKCLWAGDNDPPLQIAANKFKLVISHSLATFLTFRLPYTDTPSSICSEPESQMGLSFAQYNLYLFRDCQG